MTKNNKRCGWYIIERKTFFNLKGIDKKRLNIDK